jgi:hypothetical protein
MVMEKSLFDSWLSKLGEAWSERNPQKAAALFSKDCRYYESVFNEPCESWEDILKLWLVVPENQKDVTFEHNILCVSDNTGIANWKVVRTLLPSNKKQYIDGIFQVSLNKQGLCTFFKQWRAVRE